MIIGIIVSSIILLIVIVYSIFESNNSKLKEKTKISFKEGMDLTELPIATFYCGKQKLHFLLDTGSNVSFIDKNVLKKVPHKRAIAVSSTIGVEGKPIETYHYTLNIGYKGNNFYEEFGAIDFTDTFTQIEKESGVRLHGILGSKFFEKYKYILDFSDLTAYTNYDLLSKCRKKNSRKS